VWTYDSIEDRTVDGRPLKWLALGDEYPRACLVGSVGSGVTGADVRRVLARVIGWRGAPTRLRSDNGSEFSFKWHSLAPGRLILRLDQPGR
jgi:hypothetical protein